MHGVAWHGMWIIWSLIQVHRLAGCFWPGGGGGGGGCRLVLTEDLHKELYVKEILQETKGS